MHCHSQENPSKRISYCFFVTPCYFICLKWTFLFLNSFQDYYRFLFFFYYVLVLRYFSLFAWIMASCKSVVSSSLESMRKTKETRLALSHQKIWFVYSLRFILVLVLWNQMNCIACVIYGWHRVICVALHARKCFQYFLCIRSNVMCSYINELES